MLECISIFFCFGARGHSGNLFEQCFRPERSPWRRCLFPSSHVGDPTGKLQWKHLFFSVTGQIWRFLSDMWREETCRDLTEVFVFSSDAQMSFYLNQGCTNLTFSVPISMPELCVSVDTWYRSDTVVELIINYTPSTLYLPSTMWKRLKVPDFTN